MRHKHLTVFIVLATLIGIGTIGGAVQNATDKPLYLVARRELSDPLFKESVILMLPSTDSDLVVGLIVNKPTRISLREVFPTNPALKDRTDTVYFGGPVDIRTPSVLFLSSKPIEQAVHLDGDLYISFDLDFIEETLVKPEEQVKDVRLFLGRAQWAPEQLQGEILRGSWYSEREENSWIFRRDPENVWSVLIGRLESGTLI
jgi:putative transcriptional regulator